MSKNKKPWKYEKPKPTIKEKVTKKVNWVVEKTVGKIFAKSSLDTNAARIVKILPMLRNIPSGIDRTRNDVLDGARIDIKSAIEKGLTDEQILQPAIDSPNYRMLMNELGITFDQLKVIIKEERKALGKH